MVYNLLNQQEAWRPNKLHCNLNSRPGNRAAGTHYWNTHKGTLSEHVKQDWCATRAKFWENDWRAELWSISGPKMTAKLVLWGRYWIHLYKWLQFTCKPWLIWNQWRNILGKLPNTRIRPIWGPKVAQKWASDAHILHSSKSTCSEHMKQYWCETSEKVLIKWPKTRIFIYFGAQNDPKIGPLRHILHSSKRSCNEHVKQYWCETSGNF